jgi:hypothetical protein
VTTTVQFGPGRREVVTRHRVALWIDLAATIPLLVDWLLVRRWHGLGGNASMPTTVSAREVRE